MKIGSGIVIGKDDAAGASAVRKPPEDRRERDPNPDPTSTEGAVDQSARLFVACT
jgi:hypothetical protein